MRSRSLSVAALLLGAGCATVDRAPPPGPAAEAVTARPAEAQPAPATPAVVMAPPPATPEAPVPPARPPAVPATKAQPPVAAAPAPAKPAATVAAPPPAAPKPAPPRVAAPKQPAAAPLDLAALETRLRETRAIGVMTKLSLKNQVDDLLDKFRAYYRRQAKTSLAELRRPYDMLLLKVLSLLQDSDPPLARDIVASREAIWGILADPQKFNEAKLMAGETP